ncbi:MAG: L-threonylcarbamoyladenylate synthase [Candidatus Bilamarchaeaceae archaeon]
MVVVRILKLGKLSDVIKEAKKVVEEGGIIIYPTDTVYGIGGDATEPSVVKKVKDIKKITDDKPFSVMFSDISMIEEYCIVDFATELILKKYLPGPYTFILKLHRPIAAANDLTLGVRIPELSFCYELCNAVKRPIITTSANITGFSPPTKFSDIDSRLIEKVDLAIDSGSTKYGAPSTIIDLVEKKIRRQGEAPIDLQEFLSI